MTELDADTLLRTLLAHEVDFIVIGGFAVVAHGYVRGTQDLDIALGPEPENRRRLHAALTALNGEHADQGDFRPEGMRVPLAPEGLNEGANWAIDTTAGRIDVFQWVAGLDDLEPLWKSAVEGEIPGVGLVRFAGYDDVIAMKRAAVRPEDETDLARLRRARGEE